MKKALLILFLTLFCIACEKAAETVTQMPNAEVDCREAQCNMALDGLNVFIIVTKSGCDNPDFDPVASGSTVVGCTSRGCVGTVNSWIDSKDNPVTEIFTGSYSFCSYIDANDNAQLDAGEMASVDDFLISSSGRVSLTTWAESD